MLRLKGHLAVEFVDNLVCYHQPQPDSLCVQLFLVLDEPKQLEELVLLSFRNAESGVLNIDLEVSVLLLQKNPDLDFYLSLLSELQGVRL